MRVLFVAQQYDYGEKSKGLSFEHYNFYTSLCAMGFDVDYFDYPTLVEELGRKQANRYLEKTVLRDKPDVLFGIIRRGLIDRRVMRRISAKTDTVTINWFCDDHWQFETLARKWTPCFNYVVTTSQTALGKYEACGFNNVIKSQWGADHLQYQPAAGPPQYDVTFVGQPYGIRTEAIDALKRAGIRVRAWGNGWPDGRLSQAEMIRVFGQSRINLNFADASCHARTRLEMFAMSHAVRSLRDTPGLWRVCTAAQRLAAIDKARAERRSPPVPRQIKGRVFEVPACGGFLLTQPAENLSDYLKPGTQCATFETVDDLVDITRYYLSHETLRASIAKAGYERTVGEHRWVDRLAEVFQQAGVALPHTSMRESALDPVLQEAA